MLGNGAERARAADRRDELRLAARAARCRSTASRRSGSGTAREAARHLRVPGARSTDALRAEIERRRAPRLSTCSAAATGRASTCASTRAGVPNIVEVNPLPGILPDPGGQLVPAEGGARRRARLRRAHRRAALAAPRPARQGVAARRGAQRVKIAILFDGATAYADARPAHPRHRRSHRARRSSPRGTRSSASPSTRTGSGSRSCAAASSTSSSTCARASTASRRSSRRSSPCSSCSDFPFTGSSSWTTALCLRKHVVNAAARARRAAGAEVRRRPPRRADPVASASRPSASRRRKMRRSASSSARSCATRAQLAERVERDARAVGRGARPALRRRPRGERRHPRRRRAADRRDRLRPACRKGMWRIVTYRSKWETGSDEDLGAAPRCPARLPAERRQRRCARSPSRRGARRRHRLRPRRHAHRRARPAVDPRGERESRHRARRRASRAWRASPASSTARSFGSICELGLQRSARRRSRPADDGRSRSGCRASTPSGGRARSLRRRRGVATRCDSALCVARASRPRSPRCSTRPASFSRRRGRRRARAVRRDVRDAPARAPMIRRRRRTTSSSARSTDGQLVGLRLLRRDAGHRSHVRPLLDRGAIRLPGTRRRARARARGRAPAPRAWSAAARRRDVVAPRLRGHAAVLRAQRLRRGRPRARFLRPGGRPDHVSTHTPHHTRARSSDAMSDWQKILRDESISTLDELKRTWPNGSATKRPNGRSTSRRCSRRSTTSRCASRRDVARADQGSRRPDVATVRPDGPGARRSSTA